MTLAGWLSAIAVGLLAGAVSGLVGIGGGAVMVPFLYFFFDRPDLFGTAVPAAERAVVAHATSLLVIIPISLRGAWLYHRAGCVEWDAVWRMGLTSVVTAVIGARVAVALPSEVLKVAFGIFLLVVATRLVIGKRPTETAAGASHAHDMLRALVGGAAVGFFSATLGVGGGLVAIPVLLYWLHLPIRKVSGTSLAIITFTAAAGVLSYLAAGWTREPTLASAFYYIRMPAAAALAIGALLSVPLGTRLQQRTPTHRLRYLFAVVFFALGARILISNLLTLLNSA